LGADLTRGRVVGERIRCALHAWEYDANGLCVHVPGVRDIPTAARQPSLATAEHLGLIWGFLGEGPPPELPSPEGFGESLLSRPYAATLTLPLAMIGNNAFDTHHLLPLHHRALDAPPELTLLSPRRIRLRYGASVVGNDVYDRLTRALGVRHVVVEIDCWDGGQLVFHHRRLGAFMLLAAQIVDDETTRVYLRTGRPRRWKQGLLRPLDRLLLELHHRLILMFVFKDLEALRGMRFRPGVLLPEKDRELIGWNSYFTAVPRIPVPE
jgi:phenylpropionate dioxygenase-like ring-hydroxylating dioxygenase large terminal subunit